MVVIGDKRGPARVYVAHIAVCGDVEVDRLEVVGWGAKTVKLRSRAESLGCRLVVGRHEVFETRLDALLSLEDAMSGELVEHSERLERARSNLEKVSRKAMAEKGGPE